jgi:flagellar motor switch protein FliM
MSDRLRVDTDHALSQEDIDALFQSQAAGGATARTSIAQRYDFRRSDRIPKEQMRALRVVHDTFARSLASSLSAYLRTYITVNLISVEQLSFREFTTCLPAPTCIATMRVSPFEGAAILEINPTLAFPLIEVMLGGGKLKPVPIEREMTDIERQIFDGLLTLILQNLSLAWHSVARVEFSVESHETEPALLHVLPPNEAIVSIATEIQLAETSGMMNVGVPASIVKLLRQKFDQQWSPRRANIADDEGAQMFERIRDATVRVDARMEGSSVVFADVLRLSAGDLLVLDSTVQDPVTVLVNGLPKFHAKATVSGRRKAVQIESAL